MLKCPICDISLVPTSVLKGFPVREDLIITYLVTVEKCISCDLTLSGPKAAYQELEAFRPKLKELNLWTDTMEGYYNKFKGKYDAK